MSNFQKASDFHLQSAEMLLKPVPSLNFTGFPKFNECLKGMRSREFTILCGATGAGKTTFLAAMAVDLIKQNVPIYVASVETGPLDFYVRMMSCVARQNWNLGEALDPLKFTQFHVNNPWFQNMPLYLSRYEDRVSNEVLLGDIKKAVIDHGVKIAMLDNLNFFMEVTSNQNQIIEMDRVVHDAIIFCKHHDVHLIMVMHPKKTDHGRVENEFEIKGSSTAVQEAHNVWLLNRPKDINEYTYEYRDLKIVKCRRYGKHVGKEVTFRGIDGVYFIEEDYDREPRNSKKHFNGYRGNPND